MLHSSIAPKLFGADPKYFLGERPNLSGTEFSCDNSKYFLGEQEIKISIWARVLLCSWFYVVNLPFG